jgi:hypothetical protein
MNHSFKSVSEQNSTMIEKQPIEIEIRDSNGCAWETWFTLRPDDIFIFIARQSLNTWCHSLNAIFKAIRPWGSPRVLPKLHFFLRSGSVISFFTTLNPVSGCKISCHFRFSIVYAVPLHLTLPTAYYFPISYPRELDYLRFQFLSLRGIVLFRSAWIVRWLLSWIAFVQRLSRALFSCGDRLFLLFSSFTIYRFLLFSLFRWCFW